MSLSLSLACRFIGLILLISLLPTQCYFFLSPSHLNYLTTVFVALLGLFYLLSSCYFIILSFSRSLISPPLWSYLVPLSALSFPCPYLSGSILFKTVLSIGSSIEFIGRYKTCMRADRQAAALHRIQLLQQGENLIVIFAVGRGEFLISILKVQ